ncbi:MAG: RtcB family protein [Acidimicrobiia bacterium]
MREIDSPGIPIYTWAPDLEDGAATQAHNCARLPVAFHHVAVMADGHQGYGVPIGAVLALQDAISPYAVGNDIGCGMALVPTTVPRDDLLAPLPAKRGAGGRIARDEIMGRVQQVVPSGAEGQRVPAGPSDVDPLLDQAFEAMVEAAGLSGVRLSTSASPNASAGRSLTAGDFRRRGRSHLGTLGSGNHFIELLADPGGCVWLMLHSGSRGIGGLVCNNFHRMALRHCAELGWSLPDPGLAWLPMGSGDDRWERVGACYARALDAALEYARRNRRTMLEAVGGLVEGHFPDSMRWEGIVNIHHNDATLEEHYGSRVWVHRKGAVKASAGTATITPGSMGSGTYLGRGRGRPESFSSCSHGAGRVLSRGRARRELSLPSQLETITRAGGKVFAASTEAVLDEMPGAYKDLDQVMANQADLVEPVLRLTPLGTYKGADPPRRGNKGR